MESFGRIAALRRSLSHRENGVAVLPQTAQAETMSVRAHCDSRSDGIGARVRPSIPVPADSLPVAMTSTC